MLVTIGPDNLFHVSRDGKRWANLENKCLWQHAMADEQI